ncbi:MAG: radical SAM/SPASM domain-containing protein [Nanoarchaeota archaeon]
MNAKYLLKEAKYYKKLGKGHLRRMTMKFLLAKTPLSKTINTPIYNQIYSKIVEKKMQKSRPSILQIENTNFCNARCIMCPHTIMKRKNKVMSEKDFIEICKNVMKYENIKLVILSGFGEPFVDSAIDKKIKWLNENYPKTDIDIYTNASLLNEELTEKLLKLKIHKINFSINGTEKTYKKIMDLNYEKTKGKIINFLDRKKELKLNYPLTNISLMILKENNKEIEKIIEFWKNRADSVMAYMPSDWAGSIGIDFVTKTPFKERRWPCQVLWSTITADVDGNVIMCCRDYESMVKFGNLKRQNIREIRTSKKFRDLLDKQAKGDYKTPICVRCDNVFDSSLNWW